MLPEHRIILRLEMEYPDGTRWEERLTLSPHTFDCFRPLPRDREIHFNIQSYTAAVKQSQERQEAIQFLSRQLFGVILKGVCSKDTINGYPPEEFRKL